MLEVPSVCEFVVVVEVEALKPSAAIFVILRSIPVVIVVPIEKVEDADNPCPKQYCKQIV